MDYSIKSLNTENSKVKKHTQRQDEMSKIIQAVRDEWTRKEHKLDIPDAVKALQKQMARTDEDKVRKTLEHYQKLDVLYIDKHDKIYFV